ncbi:filamentous hemagglutinin N-terminal domain-containing protein [Tardiphaga sp. 37S4]|uniref:MBG domain-containing protein n=1 Tax=Tardiphaga sp. 37S4 TaxID=1404741 RepID=UPI001E543DD5|nr:MBG domain-containing protein [Tardiphaga sp. 37S4]UFS76452.1 filamentous hemagglutinin N-terminal domain-containing protein [Tardiphaga sp. 37S4]
MTQTYDVTPIRGSVRAAFAPLVFGCVVFSGSIALAQTLPGGGTVTHGAASIAAPSNGTLNVNQSSNSAIINWNSFSIGAGGTVNFNQPSAAAATLNRVTGTTPSSIAGTINAPGTVLLVNPNGIAITNTGVVNTGSFAASTLDIRNEDFLSGKYKFTGNGSSAVVTNAGRINVSDGGFAALLGGRVANDGVISARLGKVGLGSGEMITLDLSGDGFLSVAVPSNQLGNLVDGTGKALVTNSGKIRADGGQVFLSAATANNILRDAVNVPGTIRANSVGTRAGRIVLGGGEGGRVNVSGRVTATGKSRNQVAAKKTGGQIDISGAEIALAGARIDASGAAGGGGVRIGGDAYGRGDFQHAVKVTADSATVIRADALDSGKGGKIVLWSDGLTSVRSTLSARGGVNGGDGGLIETSGKQLDFAGIRVDASAPKGRTGDWLLDPVTLTIDSAAAATIGANLGSANVTLITTASSASGPGNQSQGAGDIIINAPISWTSANTLYLNAYRDIQINGTLSGSNGGTLWLTAPGNITQTAPILVTNLILPLNFSSVALTSTGNRVANMWTDYSSVDPDRDDNVINPGALAFTNNGNLAVGRVDGRDVSLIVGGSLSNLSGISARGSLSIVTSGDISGAGHLSGGNLSVVSGGAITAGGLGSYGTASLRAAGNIQINGHIYDLGSPLSSVTLRSDNGLVNFSANARVNTNTAVEILYNPYAATGSYANTIDYSSVTQSGYGATVRAYMLVNDVNQLKAIETNLGGTYALGRDIDASATSTWTCLSGICRGFDPIGTNVNNSNQAFTGTLDGRGYAILNMYQRRGEGQVGGGDVGVFYLNSGTIRNVGIIGGSFSGNGSYVGSIAAQNNGTLTNVYSTASVTNIASSLGAGGLVARNNGTINGGSYSTGAIRGYVAGGIAGYNYGTIQDSWTSGSVTGGTVGGIVGVNGEHATVRWTYSLASVSGTSWTGGLVGENQWSVTGWGVVEDSYAAGALSGTGVGGIVGKNDFRDYDTMESFNSQTGMSARVWHVYWDQAVSGTGRAFGWSYNDMPGGWSSEQVQFIASLNTNSGNNPYAMSSYNFFNDPNPGNQWSMGNFHDHWYMVDGYTRPFLKAEYSTNIQNLHQLQLVNMNGAASYKLARDINASAELSSGMWNNNAFSPISPISYTGYTTKVFTRLQFGENRPSDSYQVWNNGVLEIYTTIYTLGDTGYSQSAQYADYVKTPSSFTGTLDGQGHAIRNLFVNMTDGNHAGVFAYLASGSVVKNLGVVDSRIIADWGSAGSIAGVSDGTIFRSWASRSDDASGVYSNWAAGGLVGYNRGTIEESYSTVAVEAVGQQSDYVTFVGQGGGLAGVNVNENGGPGRIVNSYATGLVRGNGTIGGLVGTNATNDGTGTIINSYTTGRLDRAWDYGVHFVGSVVGRNVSDNGRTGTVTNTYYDSSVSNPSWLNPNRGQTFVGTGLTTAQMQDLNTFRTVYTGWDYRNVWIPSNSAGQSDGVARYPEFYWANHVAVVETSNATRMYGDANTTLAAMIYGLRNYDTPNVMPVTVSSTANQSSGVGTYAVSAGLTVLPPQAVGSGAPGVGGSGPQYLGMRINGGSDILWDRSSSAQQIADRINQFTYQNGVTATVNGNGAIVLTGTGTFSLVPMGVTIGDGVAWLHLTPYVQITSTQLQPVSTDGARYRIVNLPSGQLTVTQRAITVAADAGQGKTYGDTGSALTWQVTSGSLVNGDSLTGTIGRAAGENAGNYTINQGSLAASSNYRVSFVGTDYSIAKRTVTLSLTGTVQKQYDGTNTAALGASNFTLSNVVAGDAGLLSVANLPTSGSYDNANAGSGKTVTFNLGSGGLAGSAAGNYTLVVTNSRNIGSVTKAALTITANDQSKTYGDTLALGSTGYSVGGTLYGTDRVTGVTLASLGADALANVTGAPYGITASNALGNGLGNYTISYVGGSLLVAAADIIVSANGGSSVYGQSPSNPGFTAQGLKNGQNVDVLTGLSNSFGILPTTGVAGGPYTLSVAGALTNANYRVAARNDASWTVTPASIVVSANGGTSVYGSSPLNPGLSATGLQNNEGVDVLAGLRNSFGITATSGVAHGPYALSALGTLANPNYQVSAFNPGSWTVTPASIVVTANGGTSVYGSSPLNPGLSAIGLQNGQGIEVLTGLVNSFGITGRTGVAGNPYLLDVAGTLTNPNYAISARNSGVWIVTAAPLTVTADPQSKMFAELDPALTYRLTGGTLFNGDRFSGSLERALGDVVGDYAIRLGSLGVSPNYALSYVGAVFTIKSFNVSLAPSPGQIAVVNPAAPTTNTMSPSPVGSPKSSFDNLFQAPPSSPAPTGIVAGNAGGRTNTNGSPNDDVTNSIGGERRDERKRRNGR